MTCAKNLARAKRSLPLAFVRSFLTQNRRGRFVTLCGLSLLLVAAVLAQQTAPGLWVPLPSLPLTGGIGEANHTATLLGDGRILVAGGNTQPIGPSAPALAVASLYDPIQNGWFSLPRMVTDRAYHGAALLQNLTSVLVAGGYSGTTAALSFNVGGDCGIQNPLGHISASTGFGTKAAELFNENTFGWTQAASMNSARAEFTLVRLLNGQILAPAGDWGGQTAEIYNPTSDTWSYTASMNGGRVGAATTLLPDGRVFVAGGNFGYNVAGIAINCPADGEVYDPNANTWSGTGGMSWNHYQATASIVAVKDGTERVLVTGGFDGNDGNLPVLATTELWDPSTNNFTTAAPMHSARAFHTATNLPNGQILVTGGVDNTRSPLNSAEIYDPLTDTWTVVQNMGSARSGQSATLELGPGPTKVVVAGGFSQGTTSPENPLAFLSSAELFQPTPIPSNISVSATQTLPGTNSQSSCQGGFQAFVGSATGFGLPSGGEVVFFDGGSPISNPIMLANGQAVLDINLAVGTHSIQANYNSDNAFLPSVSSTLNQQVIAPPIQVTGPQTALLGSAVTLFPSVPAGATSPYSFNWTPPNGTGVALCSIAVSGCFAGIPPAVGPNVFTVNGTDAIGCQLGTGTFTVNVSMGHLGVSAPATATASTAFNFTVTVLDSSNRVVTGYTGTVHFTSTDPQAVLPQNYTFTSSDGGSHTFSATLKTAGSQTISAADTTNASLTGISGQILVSDFSIEAFSPITIKVGTSGDSTVTVTSLSGFSSGVGLSVSTPPTGVTTSFSSASVTPPSGGSATSSLTVSIGPSVTPTTFTLTVTGTSGALTHSTQLSVTVTATTTAIAAMIATFVNASAVDNSGISNALTNKLSAAQSAISAGDFKTATNTLTALKNQINAQAGKHIATNCTIAGVTFNPASVLLTDVQALIDSLRVGLIPDPITGYVVDGNGVGVPGATVSVVLLDQSGQPVQTVATATTDITGFYFFATMSVLNPGSSYAVSVTGLPAGFTISTPAMSPAFTWSGTGMTVGNFVLN